MQLRFPPGKVLLLGIFALPVLGHGILAFETAREKIHARRVLVPTRPFSELLVEFGKPKQMWNGTDSVPRRFEDVIPESGPTNCLVYHYAREGLPYWEHPYGD
ncbi:MAG: hypothetical protein RI897_272 [Verrucomicrobiota bacterium]|jgi:hypothetical protein